MKKEKREIFEEQFTIEVAEYKKELVKCINKNPGATLNELYDNWAGLDGYDFMKAMIALFEEHKVVEDSGFYFSDETTRQKTNY
jgi:hypothetical protein